jgi:hypothetical protein
MSERIGIGKWIELLLGDKRETPGNRKRKKPEKNSVPQQGNY